MTWKKIRGTKMIWAAVLIITTAQFAITYFPPLQQIFDMKAVPFLDGLLIVAVGMIFFALIEIEKQLRLRLRMIRA